MMLGRIVHAVSIVLSVLFAFATGHALALRDVPQIISLGSALIVFIMVSLGLCVTGNVDTDED